MNQFKNIIKNSSKFNQEIKLARGLILNLNNTKHRDGNSGI